MWRNGRRKGLKIPRGGPVPVRVRSQAPLTEVSPFWRKNMRPLLCLIFFRSFGSLPPPCCDRTVRNSDAIAPRYSCISPSPIGNRYSVADSVRYLQLPQLHQRFEQTLARLDTKASRRTLSALAIPSSLRSSLRLEAIQKNREFGTNAAPFFLS